MAMEKITTTVAEVVAAERDVFFLFSIGIY
jgi:hypothetical protein